MSITDTYMAEVIDFAERIREQCPPVQSEVDGIRVLKVLLAVCQSQQEKPTVELVQS